MKKQYSLALFSLFLIQVVSGSNYHQNTFANSSDFNKHYTPTSYKIAEFNQITLSLNPWEMVPSIAWFCVSYFHVQNRRNRAMRYEVDKKYGSRPASYYQQHCTEHQVSGASNYYQSEMRDPYSTFYVDPIFEYLEYYRFPRFQKALFEHPNYESSILEMERRTWYMSKDDLRPRGYYEGELRGIIKQLANQVRKNRHREEEEWQEYLRQKAQREEQQRKLKLESEAKKEKERQAYQQTIKRGMAHDAKLEAYCALYKAQEPREIDTAASRHAKRIERRRKAFTGYNHGCDAFKEKTFTLLDNAQRLLHEKGMQAQDYITFYGNKLQRILHKEFVEIIHDTADMRYVKDHATKDRESVATTIMRFVETGELYNKHGSLGKAFSFADFCWGLLDCSLYVLETDIQIRCAAAKGVTRGWVNFGCKLVQPVRSLAELKDEIQYLGDFTWEYLKFAHEERAKSIKKLRQKIIQDECDLHMGKATRADLFLRDVAFFKAELGPTVNRVKHILHYAHANANRETLLIGVEKVAEVGTEMFLTNKTISCFSELIGAGSKALEEIISAGSGNDAFYNLPLNGQTMQALISYDATMQEVRVATAQAVSVGGAAVQEVIDDIAYVLPPVLFKNNGGNGQKTAQRIKYPPQPVGDVLNIKQLSSAHAAYLAKTYDGVCSYDGVPVTFRYDHAWNGDISQSGDLGGMHHDMMGQIEYQGLLHTTAIFPENFYKGSVYSRGQWFDKTWFPNNWLVDDVMQSVFETIKNPNHRKIVKSNVTLLEHMRSSGVIIRVVLDTKTGKCLSFYPRLK